ncbi:hypothetical protein JDM601_3798 [Mycolicibacter sinensis]|uniref:Uncharacterized protein n=1 Tax=Mycolicibacter sinensis (strain JDM601) TaxID=875328 RepID=F5YRK7_MYCSD|nr:hypothetical protein JDM601_3798 [Mycolicibacter sinensis]
MGSLLFAVPAPADPATDFLSTLRESGYDLGSTTYDEEMTLINASTACSLMHYDYTPEQARDYLRFQYPDVAPSQLAVLVSVAQQTLCGPQFTPVEHDW